MPISTQQIQSWGVVGAGGAGFPTHVKLNAQAEYVILNAAECEPLLHKDKQLLLAYGDKVLQGLAEAGRLVGAKQTVVGVKGKYQDVVSQLRPQLSESMSITELSDSYPAGDEFILVYDVTGRIIEPGQIPLSVGCVVINVETALNIANQKPVTTKFLTVAGAVNNPVTVEVPIGSTYADAIELAGGPNVSDPVAIVGGAMMGSYTEDFTQPITKTTGGLIILNREHQLAQRYTQTWDQIARIGSSACDQCTYCTFFCPRYLLGHPIEPHKAMRSLGFNLVGESNTIGTQFCCECNLCTMMACPEDLHPKAVCSQNKARIMQSGEKWQAKADPDRAAIHMDNRRTPIPRLITRLGLSKFNNTGPLIEETCHPSRVVIPLGQHIGAPAGAIVSVGQQVNVGDIIAQPDEGKLGATIHASIAGRVTEVNSAITIEA